MGSSRPVDRSIGEATFLPQWMKGKMDTSRYDYGDTAFSPPADDDFFVIRYAKHQEQLKASANNAQEGFRQFSEGQATAAAATASSTQQPAASQAPTTSFSRAPLAFQSFIPFMSDRVCEPKIILANKSNKSSDDESCNTTTQDRGRSIVSVASQLVSSKFGKSNSANAASNQKSSSSNATANTTQQQQSSAQKASKSLPATPLTSPSSTPEGSPKTRRRNRYFNGAFVPDGDRKGWLLSSILGQSREFIAPHKIDEEEESQPDQVPAHAFNRKKSISSQNLTYLGKEDSSAGTEKNNSSSLSILKVNPSELREMNFWTPTSM